MASFEPIRVAQIDRNNHLHNYLSTAHEKYIIFLKDFYQNVINTTNPMDTDIIKFFYRNQEKINQISEVKNNFVSFVISEVEKARININEKLKGKLIDEI